MSDIVKSVLSDLDAASDVPPSKQGKGDSSAARSVLTSTASANVDFAMPGFRPSETNLLARERRGWGPRFQPGLDEAEGRKQYRRICDDLAAEVRRLEGFVVDGKLQDEASGSVAEIQELLERLYDCPFGQGESLKGVVVALQSQLNNTLWSAEHVAFLNAAIQHLRRRWIVNDQTVEEIDDLIEEHGLDPFRGTVSEGDVLVRYRIERVDAD